MNQKQQDSLAKLAYNLGQSLILACFATAFMPHTVSSKYLLLAMIMAALCIKSAYDIEGWEQENE